jgi:hypothetical protein
MSLLRDIQNSAVQSDVDVSTLLRKCKILAVRLGNEQFKRWVDAELNGYDAKEDLPDYRKLSVESVGHFSGFAGSGLRNAPIPPMCIPEEFRDSVRYSYMMQPISSYAALVKNSKGSNAQENWPADLTAFVGRKIYQHMNCIMAWKIIPHNALVALLDTVKTRILNFSLEIEAVAPNAGEAAPNSPPLAQERVSHVFNTYITGNVQNVATGGTNVEQHAVKSGASAELFQSILQAIDKAKDAAGASDIKRSVEEMQATYGKETFVSRYHSFMSVLSDHIQVFGPVVAPYLPALTKLLAP